MSLAPLPPPLSFSSSHGCPHCSPVKSMVMGPGACSHMRVSLVTCTLGTLASGDKWQGADLTHLRPPHWHLGAAHVPCNGMKGHDSHVGGVLGAGERRAAQAGRRRPGASQASPNHQCFWGKTTFKRARPQVSPRV